MSNNQIGYRLSDININFKSNSKKRSKSRNKKFKIDLDLYTEYDLYRIEEEKEFYSQETDELFGEEFSSDEDYPFTDTDSDDLSDDTEDEIIEPVELFDKYEVTTKIKISRLDFQIGNWIKKDYLVERDNQYIMTEDIIKVLDDYYQLFVDNQAKLMKTVGKNMIIQINTPFIHEPLPTNIKPLKLTVKRLRYLFEYGYIRKCDQLELNHKPIIAQLNPDNTYSLDYQYLNSITEDTVYAPLIDKNELFQSFFPHYVYSKIKINDAYLQLSLDSNSCHKTAFKLQDDDTVYEFTSFHEGLKNSEKYLQFAFNSILLADQYPNEELDGIDINEYRRNIKIYLDEILICSHYEFQDYGEDGLLVHNCFYHLKLLKIVLYRLKLFNIKINVTDSFFLVDKIRFIDRDLSQDYILIDRKKISKILTFSEPSTKKEVTEFLDLVYECRDYSSILFYELLPLMNKLDFLSYLNSFLDNEDFVKTFILIRNSFRVYFN